MTIQIEPEVPVLFGNVLKQKRRAFACKAGAAAQLVSPILNAAGESVALAGTPLSGATWKARLVEAATLTEYLQEATATVDTVRQNTVLVDLPDALKEIPGVYLMSVGAFDENNNLLLTNEFYVYIEPSLWGNTEKARASNLPSIEYVRLSVRDSDILENELLHGRQFFLTDIAWAAVETVHAYNITPPNIPRLAVDTTCFPEHDLFIAGIKANLFSQLVEHYRRNSLLYQAGNIAINDNKLQEYTLAYQEKLKQFEQMCTVLKASYNIRAGIGWAGGYWRRR